QLRASTLLASRPRRAAGWDRPVPLPPAPVHAARPTRCSLVARVRPVARTNWAGNYTYGARHVHRPKQLEEAQEIISRAERIHVLGSGHSFTSIVDSAELISLEALPVHCEVDRAARTVTASGTIRYGQLATALQRADLALPNLASLPHIAVAGAVQTATHGSGNGNGNLATSVTAIEFLRSDGELVSIARGDPDF